MGIQGLLLSSDQLREGLSDGHPFATDRIAPDKRAWSHAFLIYLILDFWRNAHFKSL
jgi:hypothetical protein